MFKIQAASRRIPMPLVRPRTTSRTYFWGRASRQTNPKQSPKQVSKQNSRTWYDFGKAWLFRLPLIAYYFVGAFLAAHIFQTYFFVIDYAWGISMVPTLNSSGDALVISKVYRKGRGIKVGDIVSFRSVLDEREAAVKRVVGMPGDFVLRDTPGKGSQEMIQLPEGHCYVAGDNLTWSRDSRVYGPLPLALINGKIIARISGFSIEVVRNGLQPYGGGAGDDDDEDLD